MWDVSKYGEVQVGRLPSEYDRTRFVSTLTSTDADRISIGESEVPELLKSVIEKSIKLTEE